MSLGDVSGTIVPMSLIAVPAAQEHYLAWEKEMPFANSNINIPVDYYSEQARNLYRIYRFGKDYVKQDSKYQNHTGLRFRSSSPNTTITQYGHEMNTGAYMYEATASPLVYGQSGEMTVGFFVKAKTDIYSLYDFLKFSLSTNPTTSGKIEFRIDGYYKARIKNFGELASTGAIGNNERHHVALTFRRGSGIAPLPSAVAHLYVDGILNASLSGTDGTPGDNGLYLYYGDFGTNAQIYSSDLRIYNRCLTSGEIWNLAKYPEDLFVKPHFQQKIKQYESAGHVMELFLEGASDVTGTIPLVLQAGISSTGSVPLSLIGVTNAESYSQFVSVNKSFLPKPTFPQNRIKNSNKPQTKNLVGFYDFMERNADVVFDNSKFRSSGTIYNNPSGISGIYDSKELYVFHFSGVNSGYIDLGRRPQLEPTGQITVVARFRRLAPSSTLDGCMLSCGPNVGYSMGAGATGGISASYDPIYFLHGGFPMGNIASSHNAGTGIYYDDCAWHTAIGTISRRETAFQEPSSIGGGLPVSKVKLYLDGVLVDTKSTTLPITYDTNMAIGCMGAGNTDFFDGVISNIRIYDRAWSELEVRKFTNELHDIYDDLEFILQSSGATGTGAGKFFDLYVAGREDGPYSSGNINLFTEGSSGNRVINSIDLYTKTGIDFSGTLNLCMNSLYQSSGSLNLFMLSSTGNSQYNFFPLYLETFDDFANTMPLFLQGPSSIDISGSLNLFVGGAPYTGILPMYLCNEYSGISGTLDLSIKAPGTFPGWYPAENSMNLFLKNMQSSGNMPMTLWNDQGSSSGSLNMYIDAVTGFVSGDANLFMRACDRTIGTKNLYVGGF